jgi:recombination DNA repair RAD52 pathway protein
LINYYLGFDGWSSEIKQTLQIQVPQEEGIHGKEEKYVIRCEVYISIKGLGALSSFRL